MTNIREIYLSQLHPCDYLVGKFSRYLFLAPDQAVSINTYSHLVAQGFRRSGRLVYRPHCATCQACMPARIPVNRFTPKRNQRRCWQHNQDLQVIARSPEFRQEHYELYLRYLKVRHRYGSMVASSPEDYLAFLTCPWAETLFYEFRLADSLLAVAVADLLDDGLSAVYTFFDPTFGQRGLGTFAILTEIEAVKRMGLQRLYLGYWIENCAKMRYKSNFRPLEIFQGGQWQDISKSTEMNGTPADSALSSHQPTPTL